MRRMSLPLLTLIAALPAAAQSVEVGDTAGFKQALRSVAVPAAPSSSPDAASSADASRGNPSGKTLSEDFLGGGYTVSIGGRKVGAISISAGVADERGYGKPSEEYVSRSGGAVLFRAKVMTAEPPLGERSDFGVSRRLAKVTDGAGAALGVIVEYAYAGSSVFQVKDDRSGAAVFSEKVASSDFKMTGGDLKGGKASAEVKSAHWYNHSYSIASSGVDERLIAAVVLMNSSAMSRREAIRRSWGLPGRQGR